MKFLGLLISSVLAGDGMTCNYDGVNETYTFSDNGASTTTGFANEMECMKHKCNYVSGKTPAVSDNTFEATLFDSGYIHWTQTGGVCDQSMYGISCDSLKFQRGFGPCGQLSDCKLDRHNGDQQCVTQKCKGRSPVDAGDNNGGCHCGRANKCMCNEDKNMCITARPDGRSLVCIDVDPQHKGRYPEELLDNGKTQDQTGGKHQRFLFAHLGQMMDNGVNKCTWDGRPGGRNDPEGGKRAYWPHPTRANVCCKPFYRISNKCPKDLVQSRDNATNDGCMCLDGYTRVVKSRPNKVHDLVVCELKERVEARENGTPIKKHERYIRDPNKEGGW